MSLQHTQDMFSPKWKCRVEEEGALLGFPALAGQEYGAWNLVPATGVVSHSCIGQAQSVTPAPADELDRIGPAVLLKGQFPERIRSTPTNSTTIKRLVR